MAYIREFRSKWRAEVQKHGQRLTKVCDTQEDAKLWAEAAEATLNSQKRRYSPREVFVSLGADLVTMVPRGVLEASREIPHPLFDILAAAVPTRRSSGIYFLMREGEVVYVGQSVDVLHRIARHRREGKHFDAYSYMECEAADLDRLERLYIRALVPEDNMSFGNRDIKRPISLARERVSGSHSPELPR